MVSVPLMLEYEAVLRRNAAELAMNQDDIDVVLNYICSVSEERQIYYLWRPTLPDPSDEFVLELAVEAGCGYIVTHNVADFRGAERFDLKVIPPGQFLNEIEVIQ